MKAIKLIDEQNIEDVSKFLNKFPDRQISCSLEFMRLIERSYKNCKAFYFISIKGGVISALFPFFIVKSKLFGDRAISVPFLDSSGFIGEYSDEELKEVFEELKKEKILDIQIRLSGSYKDFNHTRDVLINNKMNESVNKQQIIISLKNEEDMWQNFHKHTRNDIRKAQKSNLEVVKIDNLFEINKFYKLYSKEMRNFGTPQHSLGYFYGLLECFDDRFLAYNCYYRGKLIASVVSFSIGEYSYLTVNISDQNYRQYRPNDLLYWEIIKNSLNNFK